MSLDNRGHGCGVCLAPGDSINHLDHLAPLSYILDTPLVVDSPSLVDVLEKYYPQIETKYIDHQAKIIEYFATNFDFLFVSSANYRLDLSPLFEVLFRKKMLFWYCPHGNSDKSVDSFKHQHYFFTYGPIMEERLAKSGILENALGYVRTGNYRFPFYHKFESFYDDIIEKEVFSSFEKKQPTILYAPTWQDLENSSSFIDIGLHVPENLPSHYNLIIKLHPWLVHFKPGYVTHLEEKYRDSKNVVVLSRCPLVLPILKRSDIYLGDFSSIGYDFLYYNRPMFFFEGDEWINPKDYSSFLHRCGRKIPKDSKENLFEFIENNLENQKELDALRSEVFENAFGKEKPFEEIKEEVSTMLSQAALK